MLPGGKAILYTAHSSTSGYRDANLVVQPLPTGTRKVVHRGGYYGRYLPSGHLVYVHAATLFAAPFDPDLLEVTGPPVPALEGITDNLNIGAAQLAMSGTGTLVYLPGRGVTPDTPVSWMDRTGKTTPLRETPSNWYSILFAPDGRRLAMEIRDGKQSDIWVYDWTRDTPSRLTFDPAYDHVPVWTPDGRRIVFASRRGGTTMNLYWQRADGTGEVQRLTHSNDNHVPSSWHPNGKVLAFTELSSRTSTDIMMLPMEGNEVSGWRPGKPTAFLNTRSEEEEATFSPDGRWVAYRSDESGRLEVYVRPFPGPGGKWQISTGGGGTPTWSRARPELFYRTPDQRIMVAPYSVEGDSFRIQKPQIWSEARFTQRSGSTRSFDLHPDGERVALAPIPETQAEGKQDKVVFVFNFFDELLRIAPVKN